MTLKLVLVVTTVCVLASTAYADERSCTIPEVTLESSAAGEKFDPGPSCAVVAELINVAERESTAFADPALLGTQLELVDRKASVSADVLSLAIRLRQLECAVATGHVTHPDALYRAFLFDARALLARLGGPPPTGTLPSLDEIRASVGHRAPPQPESGPQQQNRARRDTGIILLVTGVTVGALATGLGVASSQVPQCAPDAILCFQDVTQQGLLAGAIVDGVVGGALVIAGSALLYKYGHAERARVLPTLAISPSGASAGLKLNF